MLDSTGDLTNSSGDGQGSGRRRLLARCVVGGAATVLFVAVLAWTSHGSSKHTVSLVAAPTAATIPSFCPAARAYVDKLPLLQVSLSDQSKLPGLLLSVAPGMGASISSAPADVQADVAKLSKAIGDFQAAISPAGNQISKLSPQQAVSLQSPAVSQLIIHLVRYVNSTCG